MSFTSRFSIRSKLITGFGVVLLVTGCLAAFAVQRMGTMNESTEVVTTNYFPGIVLGGEMRSIVQQIRIREARHVLSTDPTEMQVIDQEITDLAVAYSKARKHYDLVMDAGEEAELYKRIDVLWAQYRHISGCRVYGANHIGPWIHPGPRHLWADWQDDGCDATTG